nr:PREDICTED: Golgi integral membrane protein 4 isoform X2 [Latimeria chalumnae]|eukprot:XP_014347808.1 PREDICTED: Golgi integral membrane protein 4 isoform X2 [Latimeria chalumnae]
MGNSMCSRRQKRIFQAFLLLTVIFGFLYGAMLYYEVHNQLKKAETLAVKYQQHQENLSAQLQVVYEHRSRLEKSLQKERLEHKKAKEDFLVYKLEAQETLNKGRQDSNNRYSSLTMQHQMLKSQHEELKKQYGDLQENHQKLGEDFNKDLDQHKQRYLQLQQSKEQELSRMKESIYNLREENRQLRKAHQDVHVQLQDVKAQVEEYKQLKETLIKMPSLRQSEQNVPLAKEQGSYKMATASSQRHSPLEHQDHLPEEGRRDEVPPPRESELNFKKHDENPNVGGDEPGAPKEAEANGRNFGERDFRGGKAEKNDHSMRLVEEENRRELEEEEMEQAGQPERLEEEEQEEEEGQQQEDQREPPARPEGEEDEDRQRDGHQHLQKEDANLVEKHRYVEEHPPTQPAARHKSAYEEQLEQQRLAAQRAEEARQVRARQEALRFQKLKEHLSRQQQIRERELELQREAERKEQLFQQERARQQAQYNIDQDIVEGEEEQKEAHGGGEENPHDEEVEDAEPEVGRQAYPAQHENVEREHLQKEDVNPADDPNNQGEDEFEEGEQDPEDHIPEERNRQPHDHPGAEEHLVMAGNPDQQEDNVDEYQEDGEEEAQEDLAEDKKVDEENVDGPYDNEGKLGRRGGERGEIIPHNRRKEAANEENYEDEDEAPVSEEKGAYRAEM